MGHGGNRTNHTERGVLDHGEAMIAAKHLAVHELDPRHLLAEHLQLPDLVLESADLRLGKLQGPEFLGVVDGDPANVGDRLPAALHAEPLELLEGVGGGPDSLVDAPEHAVGPGRRAAGMSGGRGGGGRPDGAACGDLSDHLANDGGDVGSGCGGHGDLTFG